MPRLFFTSCYAAMEQKITLSDYNIIPGEAQFIAPTRGVQGALPPAGVWGNLSGGQVIPGLLNSNLCADFGHFVSDFLSLFLRDTFFDRPGRLVNDGFGFFEAEAGQFTDNFNDIDLVGANLAEDGIKLRLLFGGGRSSRSLLSNSRTSSLTSNGCRAYAPSLLKFFGQLHQIKDVQLFNLGNNGFYGHCMFLLIRLLGSRSAVQLLGV